MKNLFLSLGSLLWLAACSLPDDFSFDVPVENRTKVKSFSCERWFQVSDNSVKSTCDIDNREPAETGSLVILAFDSNGELLGRTQIGKVTIGEKLRLNKGMKMHSMKTPALVTLEVE